MSSAALPIRGSMLDRSLRLGLAAPRSAAAMLNLLGTRAESPDSTVEGVDRLGEIGFTEVGPECGGAVELGVGCLPEQGVAQPHLAGRPDDQVGIGQVAGVEMAGHHPLLQPGQGHSGARPLTNGVDDLRPAPRPPGGRRWSPPCAPPPGEATAPAPLGFSPPWGGGACGGGGAGPRGGGGRPPPLDLHDLAFLAGSEFVDARDVAVGKLLQLLDGAAALVGRYLLLLLHRLEAVVVVAPDVPNGHVAGLGVPLDQPHVLAAALLVQRRDGDADDLAVVGRVEAELGFLQSLLHRRDDAAVPGLDDDHASLGCADRGQLVERRGIAVVLDRDAIDQRGAGPAGPDGLDLLGQSIDALLHPALGLGQLRLDHLARLTVVPIDSSPRTTRSMLPGRVRLKTTIGRSFSLHRVIAVWSMTRSPLLMTSR